MPNTRSKIQSGSEFELFRLTKSKQIVDICPNTLRSYFKQGLPSYKKGKAVFVSKSELLTFLKAA